MNDKIEWVVVPREPTEAMWNAGKHFCDGHVTRAIQTYAAMLASAPKPEAQAAGVTDANLAEWEALRGAGMCSAVGEYTPPEFWLLLDEVKRLRALSTPASHDAQQPIDASDNFDYLEKLADRIGGAGGGALRAIAADYRHLAQQPAVVGDAWSRIEDVLNRARAQLGAAGGVGSAGAANSEIENVIGGPLIDWIADELESALTPAATPGDDLYRDDWISQAEMDQRLEHLAEEYEWRGDDGDYTPSERERLLLIDFCHGILADEVFVAMMKAHHDPNAKGRPAAQKEGNGNG